MQEWRDLQLKVNAKWEIFEKLFMAISFILWDFSRNLLRRCLRRDFHFDLGPGVMCIASYKTFQCPAFQKFSYSKTDDVCFKVQSTDIQDVIPIPLLLYPCGFCRNPSRTENSFRITIRTALYNKLNMSHSILSCYLMMDTVAFNSAIRYVGHMICCIPC